MRRSVSLFILATLAYAAICGIWAAAEDANRPLRVVAYGRLERLAERQAKYALTDETGKVTFRLVTRTPVDLTKFVGDKVRVIGRLQSGGTPDRRLVIAERIGPTNQIAAAHFVRQVDFDDLDPPPAFPLVPDEASDQSPRTTLSPPLEAGEVEPLDTLDTLDAYDPPVSINAPLLDEGQPRPMVMDEDVKLLNDPAAGVPPEVEAAPYCITPEWLWGRADLLLWRTKSMYVPALVTTSPVGTLPEDAGVLGEDGTSVLFGNTDLFDDVRTGGRLTIGGWLGKKKRFGLEGEYLGFEEIDWRYSRDSMGTDIIARPFYNVDPALAAGEAVPDSELISYPNLHAGGIEVHNLSKFRSFGLRLRGNVFCRNGCRYDPCNECGTDDSRLRVDLVGGYRFMRLDESVVVDATQVVSATPQAGFETTDSFISDNDFHGFELGVAGEYSRGRWMADGVFRVALGSTYQKMGISGRTIMGTAGIETPFEGGLLALPTNIGDYSRWKTDVVLELGLNCGYMITERLRAHIGYTIIFWPHVVRPGDNIDLNVNAQYIPDPTTTVPPVGPMRPAFVWNDTQYWAQGVNFGIDYRW